MYKVYIGKIRLPVTPGAIETTIDGNNETIQLINGGERLVLKSPKLTKVKFSVLLPNHKYPFAVYRNSYHRAKWYYTRFRKMMTKKQVVKLKIVRSLPNGKKMWKGGLKKAVIEGLTLKENAGSLGQDMELTLTFKQYKAYKTKKKKIEVNGEKVTIVEYIENKRTETESSAKPFTNGLSSKAAGMIKASLENGIDDNPPPAAVTAARQNALTQRNVYQAKGSMT